MGPCHACSDFWLTIGDGSSATVRDSDFDVDGTAISVGEDAAPTVESNTIATRDDPDEMSVIGVIGPGSSLTLRANDIVGGVMVAGASATIEANDINGTLLLMGAGEGTTVQDNRVRMTSEYAWSAVRVWSCSPIVKANDLSGPAEVGLLVSDILEVCPTSEPVIRGNTVHGAETGIEVSSGASGIVEANDVSAQHYGVVITGQGTDPAVHDNVIRAPEGIVIEDGAMPTLAGNQVEDDRNATTAQTAVPVAQPSALPSSDDAPAETKPREGKPSPTCRPGSTHRPQGCVMPGLEP